MIDVILQVLKDAGLTPIEIILAVGMLYLFLDSNAAKKNLAECYEKMNRTLAELPEQIVGMAVKFQEHRSDGINVTGDAVISGRDTTKSDVSYEPIVPRAVREEWREQEAQRKADAEGHKGTGI